MTMVTRWPHAVFSSVSNEKHAEMAAWCCKNIPMDLWPHDNWAFEFAMEEHAAWFRMVWS